MLSDDPDGFGWHQDTVIGSMVGSWLSSNHNSSCCRLVSGVMSWWCLDTVIVGSLTWLMRL